MIETLKRPVESESKASNGQGEWQRRASAGKAASAGLYLSRMGSLMRCPSLGQLSRSSPSLQVTRSREVGLVGIKGDVGRTVSSDGDNIGLLEEGEGLHVGQEPLQVTDSPDAPHGKEIYEEEAIDLVEIAEDGTETCGAQKVQAPPFSIPNKAHRVWMQSTEQAE